MPLVLGVEDPSGYVSDPFHIADRSSPIFLNYQCHSFTSSFNLKGFKDPSLLAPPSVY
jgi:hypothetical protein